MRSSLINPESQKQTVELVKSADEGLFIEIAGNYWRVFTFISDSYTYQKAQNSKQAYEAGRIIGGFQYLLSDIETDLHETLPGFHDLELHLEQFNLAVTNDLAKRAQLVKKIQKKLWQDRHMALFASLAPQTRIYLNALADANQPIKKNILRLLALKDDYGSPALIYAIEKALNHGAYGADYIENILYQEMTPQRSHPPVKLKDDSLNHIRLAEPCQAEYDSLILKRRKLK